jgi:hypothetical protein
MAAIDRYNPKAVVQRIGNDTVYGGGQDGDVVVASGTTVTLSRDMYYNSLTIQSTGHLATNGYKVFVKGTLSLSGSIGILSASVPTTNGTISAGTSAATAVTYSVGGSASGATPYSATQIPSSLLYDLEKAISGYYVDSGSTVRVIRGGAGASPGPAGTLDTNTAAPTTWTGKSGSAGSAGANGQYPPNATTVGAPGGKGYTGATGQDGVKGSDGTSGTAGAGGTGGIGGGVVIVVAKTITGTGTIYSQGASGASGGAATNGSAGSPGTAPNTPGGAQNGATGGVSPDIAYAAHVNALHHARPAHHGGGDTHTTPLPHFHNPHYHTHGYKHQDHYALHADAAGPHSSHSHNPHYNPSAMPDDHFTHRGGVNHNHWHNPSATGGYPAGGYAHMYDHGHHGHNDGSHFHSQDYYKGPHHAKHFDHSRYHQVATAWSAGPALHSYHYHALYPVGAGGAGGAAGLAGPGGRAGTPTAGTAGAPGGGGGAIVVTDTNPSTISINTSSATSGGYTSSSGMQVIVLNA